ncbi:AsmA family protein [Undibacterium cyanobacteriorum]|uniref:AsmA family protein n=1 Tax=Undibacterium cyanobacteriorum TaxID=3073561 RepID=A0ABY9RKC6_9BURK|nr:AsmA family protein [Undibacterium sp. 20NA77.5]WMW81406.1 AsmA family protein [Undibacterium sp. 20NA77.5]
MKRTLRYLAIFLGIVILLIGALLAYLALVFDPNSFKTQLSQLAQDKYQRSLRIDGDIKLRFFPKIGVDLNQLTLSEHQSAQNFASLGQARVSLAVLPLIRKKLVVDQVVVRDLQVRLSRDVDGKTNVDDFLKQNEAMPASSNSQAKQNSPLEFNIDGIEIKNAKLRLEDRKNNLIGDILSFDLTTGKIGGESRSPIQLKTHIALQQPRLDAHLDLQSELELNLAAQAFLLRDLTSQIQTKTGAETLQLKLKSKQLGYRSQQLVSDNTQLEAQLSGAESLHLKIASGKLESSTTPWRLDQLSLNVEQNKNGAIRQFNLSTSPTWRNVEQELTLAQLQAEILIKDPQLMQKEIRVPLKGEASLKLGEKQFRTTIQTQFDESKADIALALKNFSNPSIDFKIDIDQFNLDRYVKNEVQDHPSNAEQTKSPLNLKWIEPLQVRGNIALHRLQVKNLKMSEISLPIAIEGGVINLNPIRAQLYQGNLNGKIRVSSDNQISLEQSLSNININPLIQDFLRKDILEGRGSIDLALQTHGRLPEEFKRHLNGKLAVKLNDGAVKGINVAKSLRDFKAKISGRSDQQQNANQQEKTDFTAMSASMQFVNGIGNSKDLDMKSPFLRIGGSGDVDLPASKVDYTAKVVVVNTATGQDGADLAQLKDISIPIRLSGPFDHIQYQILFSQIGSDALKAAFKAKAAPAIEEKKQELKQKVNDQLKDKLKGFLSK